MAVNRRSFVRSTLAVALAPHLLGELVRGDDEQADVARAATIANTDWMRRGKYGLFMHYQYRILLGRSVATRPQFPGADEMTAGGWNRFVDGFDVAAFAKQAAAGKVGWVLFCIDDHYVANLGQLPRAGATIIVGAPKIAGTSGGPSRVLAIADAAQDVKRKD